MCTQKIYIYRDDDTESNSEHEYFTLSECHEFYIAL